LSAETFAKDLVITALRRSVRGLDKTELQRETGLGTHDLRAVLEEADTGIEEDGSRFVYRAPQEGALDALLDTPTSTPGEEGEPVSGPEDAAEGTLARAQLVLTFTYRLEGTKEPDEEAVMGARVIAEDAPGMWPGLDVKVEMGTVEVFGEPRRVWPRDEG
jgi:hypothetical protein